MSEVDWCLQKLNQLELQDDKLEILSEIKDRLNTAISAEITSNFLTRPEIFHCLQNNPSKEQSDLAFDILSICFSTLDIDQVDFPILVTRSLNHKNASVRALALHEIMKVLEKNPTLTELDPDLTILILNNLDSIETEVGGPAIKILSKILQTGYDNSKIKEIFNEKLKKEELIRTRVYEIVVNLSKESPTTLNKFQNLLDIMLQELNSDDILFQFNILELLVSLAQQNHGLTFIEEKKVFDKISKRIEEVEQNPLDRLLVPGFIKFFGKIAFNQPKRIIEGYPNMMACLFDCFTSYDFTLLPVVFDTLGNLAHSSEGKILLEDIYSERMKESFEEYASFLKTLPTDLKKRALCSLQEIFTHEGDPNNRIETITKKWCSHLLLPTHDLQTLLEFCKNPFPDIKVLCLSFLKTLCSYRWAIESISKTAGFIEFLLNRRVEFDKNVRDVKFEINSILAESNCFDAHTILQLKRYVADGPHFVESVLEVAVN